MRLFFLLVLAMGFPTLVFASNESITAFDASYQLHPNGVVDVAETITYDFGDNKRQGLFREVPYKYKVRGGKFNVRLDNVFVVDADGHVLTSDVSREDGNVKIHIGDKGVFISGEHVYKISYTVERVINHFETHDELYWNVTGDEWNIPIERATAIVQMDAGLFAWADCFIGSYGSTEKCNLVSTTEREVAEFAHEGLAAREGMTIVVGVPAGSVTKPSFLQNLLWFVSDNALLGVPFIVLAVMFHRWWSRGRDPQGKSSIVPRWEIPQGLNPVGAGLIIDERAGKDDLSSLFIDLAIRGYFTITEGEKGMFGKQDYILTKKKEWVNREFRDEIEKHEALFLSGIFEESSMIKISDLKNTFFKDVKKIKDEVYDHSATKGYFVQNPQKVRARYIGIGFAISFLSIWLGGMLSAWLTPVAMGVGFASGVIIAAFSFVMPKKTAKGVKAKEDIKGLQMYLEKAEKARLDFHNNPEYLKREPEHTTATFEKYLPYAMVLGVHDAWAQQFEGIYKNGAPEWFSGTDAANFSTTNFVSSLGGFASTAHATSVSQPSNAASGGSGFSGGGSGGGFGGGGGGSW